MTVDFLILDKPLVARLGDTSPWICEEADGEVDRIWREAQSLDECDLFNGTLLSADLIESGEISGRVVEYRYFYAQQQNHKLKERLGLRPLGVTGVMISPEGILFARRGARVFQDPGRWEVAPSGGVEQESFTASGFADLEEQVFRELEEETCIDRLHITSVSQFAYMQDTDTGVTDVVFLLHTSLRGKDIMEITSAAPRNEYSEFSVVPVGTMAAFCRENAVVESTSLIVENLVRNSV